MAFERQYQIDSTKVCTPVIQYENLKATLSCKTDSVQIYYTLDDSDPGTNGTFYTGPVAISKDCTIKAVTKKQGMTNLDMDSLSVTTTGIKRVTCDIDTKSQQIYTLDGRQIPSKSLKDLTPNIYVVGHKKIAKTKTN